MEKEMEKSVEYFRKLLKEKNRAVKHGLRLRLFK